MDIDPPSTPPTRSLSCNTEPSFTTAMGNSSRELTSSKRLDPGTVSDRAGGQLSETIDPADARSPRMEHLDLVRRIPSLFRLLDLREDPGTEGLVEKVIIDQEFLRTFVNTILPGAYTSVTKIDFAALDRVPIRPIGIYGSKSELVNFIKDKVEIDEDITRLLLNESGPHQPFLRPGIYALAPRLTNASSSAFLFYLIYWPASTTWLDDAPEAIQKGRVTFMRYLTKLADQMQALISSEHATSISLGDVEMENIESGEDFTFPLTSSETDIDMLCEDRVFDFAVAKTKDQGESANITPGFETFYPVGRQHHYSHSPAGESHKPILIGGNGRFGILDAEYLQASTAKRDYYSSGADLLHESQFNHLKHIRLSNKVGLDGFFILMERCNLRSRVTSLYEDHRRQLRELRSEIEAFEKTSQNRVHGQWDENIEMLRFGLLLELGERYQRVYSIFTLEAIIGEVPPGLDESRAREYLKTFLLAHPEVEKTFQTLSKKEFLHFLPDSDDGRYAELRQKVFTIKIALEHQPNLPSKDRQDLISRVASASDTYQDDSSYSQQILASI